MRRWNLSKAFTLIEPGPVVLVTTRQRENDNIMTLGEMAEYLKIARRSLLKMAQHGDIPATKVASQWRFMRTLVDDWLMSQMKTIPKAELERLSGEYE